LLQISGALATLNYDQSYRKTPGPDWGIFYMYIDNGSKECMSVFGSLTPEEAIAEARASLNMFCKTEEEKGQFEILAVVRQGAEIAVDFNR
jgi:hypothetical protein